MTGKLLSRAQSDRSLTPHIKKKREWTVNTGNIGGRTVRSSVECVVRSWSLQPRGTLHFLAFLVFLSRVKKRQLRPTQTSVMSHINVSYVPRKTSVVSHTNVSCVPHKRQLCPPTPNVSYVLHKHQLGPTYTSVVSPTHKTSVIFYINISCVPYIRQLCPTPTQSHARLAGEKDVCCRSITKLEIIDKRGLTLELCARLRCRCPQCQCHGPVPDLRVLNTRPTQVATEGIRSSSQSLTSVRSTLAQHTWPQQG